MTNRATLAVACLSALMLLCVSGSAADSIGVEGEIYQRISREQPTDLECSVVGVSGQGNGSGFVVSYDGLIATANHLVADLSHCLAAFVDGTIVVCDVVGRDIASDVALLRIRDTSDLKLRPLHVDANYQVLPGESVRLVAMDHSAEDTRELLSTYATVVASTQGASCEIQVKVMIELGVSGGLALNSRGDAIGIITRRQDVTDLARVAGALEIRDIIPSGSLPNSTLVEIGPHELEIDCIRVVYPRGHSVVLGSPSPDNYRFHGWYADQELVSDAEELRVGDDVPEVLLCRFEESTQLSIKASSAPSWRGEVKGGGSCFEGTTVALLAEPLPGFVLSEWREEGVSLGNANPIHIVVDSDRELVARFASTRSLSGIQSTFRVEGSTGLPCPWKAGARVGLWQFLGIGASLGFGSGRSIATSGEAQLLAYEIADPIPLVSRFTTVLACAGGYNWLRNRGLSAQGWEYSVSVQGEAWITDAYSVTLRLAISWIQVGSAYLTGARLAVGVQWGVGI